MTNAPGNTYCLREAAVSSMPSAPIPAARGIAVGSCFWPPIIAPPGGGASDAVLGTGVVPLPPEEVVGFSIPALFNALRSPLGSDGTGIEVIEVVVAEFIGGSARPGSGDRVAATAADGAAGG